MIQIPNIDPNFIANNLIAAEPTHPGEILLEELNERKLTKAELANQIGIKESILDDIVNCKRSITAEYALLLEAALGIDADFWLNMQRSYDKDTAKLDKSFLARLAEIRKIAAVL